MTSNFIPHPDLPGNGRCRVCDFAYSVRIPAEVEQHRRYHKRYLAACDGMEAPVPERTREEWRSNSLTVQHDMTIPFEHRLERAEKWFLAKHHDHLAAVLRHDIPRLGRGEFFTKFVEGKGLLVNFAPDVARELRLWYSTNFIP